MLRKNRLLNPKMDPTFKSLFTQKNIESKLALESFLSAVLGTTVVDAVVGMNELPIESERDKQSIFDITCTLKDEKQVLNIEMQGINYLNSFDNRSEYHVAHLLNHYVSKGVDWPQVPQAYMISVLNFIYDKDTPDSILHYTMRRENADELKSKRMNIIYLELPKLIEDLDTPPELLTPVQRWGKFFLYADNLDKEDYIQKLVDMEEGIMYAQNVLSEISQSDEEWRRERDYIDAINTELTIRKESFESGREQGIAQGEKLKAFADAAIMINKFKLSIDDVCTELKLSKEEVTAYLENN